MKKIFFSLLAIGAIASCAKVEAVFTEGDSEIKLAPVAALQTKADKAYHLGAVDGITYPTEENFDVYAYWKNVKAGSDFTDGSVFLQSLTEGGAEFTNKGNYWGGIDKYYWPKNGSLRFAAYSPAHLTVAHQQVDDVYTIEGYVQPSETAKTWDFLVAPTSPSYSMMTATENVAIEFQHALSWITLKVKAKDVDAAQAFNIKKVTINGVNTTADFSASMLDGIIQYDEWSNRGTAVPVVVFEGSQMVTMDLNNIESTVAGTIVIPQNTTTVTVDFDQYGLNGTADTPDMTVTLDLVLDTDDTPWVPGKHYVYNLIFGLDEILINPSVADWEDVPVGELDVDAINVSTKAQLEAALANPNATKIVFQNDIEGSFIVPEVAGRALTIDGNGFKLTGAFQIDGKSAYAGATTIYKNLNFVATDASLLYDSAFIYCGELNKNTNVRYPDNVIIENCTFTATGAAEMTAVATKFWSVNGKVAVSDCSADKLHSFMQLTSCSKADVSIYKLTATDCKNGVSLGDAANVEIRKSNIAASEYGIRANGSVANTIIDKETTIAAKQPVIVRYVTTDGYVLTVDEATLTPSSTDGYQIIFTKANDDKPYEAPTAKFTLNAATTYKVFPTPEGWVTNYEELAAALTADEENISVVLTTDIELPISSLGQQTGGSGEYKLGSENTKTITIDLNGNKLTVTTNYWSALGAKNDNVIFTIKNGTMTSSQASGTWNSYDLSFANCNYNIEDVVFEKAIAFTNATKHVSVKNVTIKETHDYYAMWISAKGQNVVIDGLTVESAGRGIKIDEQYVSAPSLVNLSVKNSTFKTEKKAAIVVKSVAGAAITLKNVDITEVKADNEFAVWVDEDAAAYADKVVVNGGYVKVEGEAKTTAKTATELKADLKVEGQTVMLIPSENGESLELGGKLSIAKGASLIGLGDAPVGIDNDWGSTTFNNQAHFTNTHIENIFFDDNMVIDAGIANGNVSFKNCIFGGDVAHQGVHFDSGNGVVVFENCTFVGRNMFGSSLEKVIFNNCTFLNKKSSLTGADKWTGVNMWGKYEFNNCVFDTDATCNVKCDGVEAAFNGCSYVDGKDIESVIRNSSNFTATITFAE